MKYFLLVLLIMLVGCEHPRRSREPMYPPSVAEWQGDLAEAQRRCLIHPVIELRAYKDLMEKKRYVAAKCADQTEIEFVYPYEGE